MAKVGFMYPVRSQEFPAIMVGEAISQDGCTRVFPVDDIGRKRNLQNMVSLGIDLVVDMRARHYDGGYFRPYNVADVVGGKSFAVPIIPLAKGYSLCDLIGQDCIREIEEKFKTFYVGALDPQNDSLRRFLLVGGRRVKLSGNAGKERSVHRFLKDSDSCGRALAIEYLTPRPRHNNGIDAPTLEKFKQETYWFASWAKRNYSNLFR